MKRSATRIKSTLNQSGVAMVTVLFIGAGLTAVTSVAALATIQEFRSGNDDRRAVGALAYAEAGIDRMLAVLRSGQLNFGELNKLGCSLAPLVVEGGVGNGQFRTTLTVYDPKGDPAANRLPVGSVPTTGGACASRPTSPHPGQHPATFPDQTFFLIESTGSHPAASRVVRQVIALEPLDLPIGIYANTVTVQSAQHVFTSVSMVTKTSITNRKRLSFLGQDSYYKMSDFYEGVTGVSGGLGAPAWAAAHSQGTIYLSNSSTPEFTTTNGGKNCSANGTSGGAVEDTSLWDSDGSTASGPITSSCGTQVGFPNSSKFTADQAARFAQPELTEQDHQMLAEAAKNYGVYCSFPGVGAPSGDQGSVCFVRGVDQGTGQSPTMVRGYIQTVSDRADVNDFVAYVHFRHGPATTNILSNPVDDVWPCSDVATEHESVVLVVKNGGIDYTGGGGDRINGAFIFDGDWTGTGAVQFNGSLISKGNIHFHSSSQTFTTDPCWVRNMPGPFLRTVQGHWSEVDR